MKLCTRRMWFLHIGLIITCAIRTLTLDLSPGETTPRVDIAVGDSANITCRMNPTVFPGQNASDLYFTNIYTQQIVPNTQILILNRTTIIYTLHNATAQNNVYRCNCGNNAIMDTNVNVGFKPRPVTDFTCSSYDFEYMVCQFTRPYNPVLVTYNLTFRTRSPHYTFDTNCNYEKNPLVVCNITRAQNYNPFDEQFHFTLTANNSLGMLEEYFLINNLNAMVPSPPGESFHMDYVTSNTTQFTWRMPKYDFYKPKGLQWEAIVEPQELKTMTIKGSVIRKEWPRLRNEFRLHFDLPFSYYNYTLKLRVKVNSSSIWSEPFYYHFRTLPTRPMRPPTTKTGSFYIDPSETTVRIYWEELTNVERNGDDFGYVISYVKKDGRTIYDTYQNMTNS